MKKRVMSKKMLAVAIVLLSCSVIVEVWGQDKPSMWSNMKDRFQNWKTEKFSNLGQGYRDMQAGNWGTSVPRENASSLWSRFKDRMSNYGRNAEIGQQERIATTTNVGKSMVSGGHDYLYYPMVGRHVDNIKRNIDDIKASERELERRGIPTWWSGLKNRVNNFGRNAEIGQQERIARTTNVGNQMIGGAQNFVEPLYTKNRGPSYYVADKVFNGVLVPLHEGRFWESAEQGRQGRIAATTDIGKRMIGGARDYIYDPLIGTKIKNERIRDEKKMRRREEKWEKNK